MLAQAPGRIHQLWGQLDQLPPTLGIHLVPEGGKLPHFLFELCAVVGVEPLGEELQVLFGQPQGLPKVLDDAFHRVGGNGPGEDGVVRPEVLVHPQDELVPESAGEVQVDVGELGRVFGDEPLQGQAPPQGIDVADADEVARQERHRGPPAPARRPLLQGNLRVRHDPLLHDLLGEKDDLPVEEEKARQTVPAYQPELLFQAFFHRFRHGAVAPERRLDAEAFQVALGGVPLWYGRLGEVIAEVGAEVEGALLRYTEGVGNGLGIVLEDVIHPGLGLQVQMVIGLG